MMNGRGSTKKPGVNQLQDDPRFQLRLELEFSEMIPFVLSNIRKKGFFSICYATMNMALLIVVVACAIMGLTGPSLSWTALLLQSLGGLFAGSILVIPPHELLHGLAYLMLGARKIRFGADLKQFIFFVTADRYPVSGGELYFLALTPFVVINAAVVVVTLVWLPGWILFSMVLLLIHNLMCIGDFAILNYILLERGKVYTYDAPEKRRSYFYKEVAELP